MKHLSRVIIAVFMAILMGTLLPVQVFADTPDYISEIKIFEGSYEGAEKEGYTLLKDGNNPVDLNQNAGGGWGSKGEKAIYLGYKTTDSKTDAITDLALMNMKGGYDTAPYDVLMEKQMNSQILPFINNFRKTINEYRANYVSKNAANKQRARYIHDALNKLYDDDTEMPLGDLLLKKTKEELGEEAYNALSDEEKKQHADLATIIAQSNGQATVILENLVTRAADTNTNSWVERFSKITYDDLIEKTGLSPTDARKKIAKLYDDDAMEILDMWDTFRQQLLKADDKLEVAEEIDADEMEENAETFDDFDLEDADDEDIDELAKASVEAELDTELLTNSLTDVMVKEYLATVKYGDGTMLDFFTLTRDEIEDDITVLYPLVASLTEGQRAGLEFVTLSTMVEIAGTNGADYKDKAVDEIEQASIYEGVNRDIYKKSGVALTSESLRKDAANLALKTGSDTFPFNWWTILSGSLGLACVTAFTTTFIYRIAKGKAVASRISNLKESIASAEKQIISYNKSCQTYAREAGKMISKGGMTWNEYNQGFLKLQDLRNEFVPIFKKQKGIAQEEINLLTERSAARSATCNKLMLGFGIAVIVLSIITTWLAWEDMKEYYKVEFTPIPQFMIDEKDLVGYNKKGEKIVLKNQAAYYTVAECNRNSDAEFFKTLGTAADMNGDVGQQWLALYTAKNELMEPVLASSLVAKVFEKAENVKIPDGYEKGIHMFGTDAAFNLNSPLYDWNNSAPLVYVYFKTGNAETTGANFTSGTIALSGGAGLILGAAVTALCISYSRKRKDNKAVHSA